MAGPSAITACIPGVTTAVTETKPNIQTMETSTEDLRPLKTSTDELQCTKPEAC